jgi:hypothetical protein
MEMLTKKPFRNFNFARSLHILILFLIFAGFVILFIWLTGYYYFSSTFSKTVITLILTAVFFIIIYLTIPLTVQFYFSVKFGIKTTRAEAKYLEPLLGTPPALGVIKWYPLNELWDIPCEKRKEALFAAASEILGCSYNNTIYGG